MNKSSDRESVLDRMVTRNISIAERSKNLLFDASAVLSVGGSVLAFGAVFYDLAAGPSGALTNNIGALGMMGLVGSLGTGVGARLIEAAESFKGKAIDATSERQSVLSNMLKKVASFDQAKAEEKSTSIGTVSSNGLESQ
ncbi:MAG: hypothetical protein CL693_00925 [Cellvibrionaceae bacterium]|nr:hypothetical protein [Cellvibrionaceae bacterium]|tara:strand:- start:2190 stop:2609 length:420 start_codon:yes stop_codon:yes gene_type:complete